MKPTPKPHLPADLLAIVARPTATAAQCRAYLRALAASEWQYHLDDDPRELGDDEADCPWRNAAGLLNQHKADCVLHLGREVAEGVYYSAGAAKGDPAARVEVTVSARQLATMLVAMVNHAEADTAVDIADADALHDKARELLGLELGAACADVWSSFCDQR